MTRYPGAFTRRRKPHYVYEVWRKGDCLYVGVTESLGGRFGHHSTQSPWWAQATDIKIAVVEDREQGLDLEAHLIDKHQPRYNWNHTERSVGSRSGRGLGDVAFQRYYEGD